jgi:hypothetical protein
MATDVTGIWDFAWIQPFTGEIEKPISTPSFTRVCFHWKGGNKYRGRFYDPELPQRSYPHWPYDHLFEAHVHSSSTPGQEYEVVSVVVHYRSSEAVATYDASQAFAGLIRTNYPGEPAPLMFGVLYGNNGDSGAWRMTKNASLGGCPDELFQE